MRGGQRLQRILTGLLTGIQVCVSTERCRSSSVFLSRACSSHMIFDKNGKPLSSGVARLHRWKEHFVELFKVANKINMERLDRIPTVSVAQDMDAVPSFE